jgi:hypothetical protein
MFGQAICTEQVDVRSENLHRAGGCSVRQCALNRRMFGQTNLHRAGGCSVSHCALCIRTKAVTHGWKVINLIHVCLVSQDNVVGLIDGFDRPGFEPIVMFVLCQNVATRRHVTRLHMSSVSSVSCVTITKVSCQSL